MLGRLAVLADAHVAGGDADDAAVLLQQFGGGEAGVDLDAQRLRLLAQPAADIAERDDVVAVVVHLRRRRQTERARRRQEQEAVVGGRRFQRRALVAPVGDQFVEGARLQAGAGQDVGADFAALFHQADRGIRVRAASGGSRRRGRTGRRLRSPRRIPLPPVGATPRPSRILPACRASLGRLPSLRKAAGRGSQWRNGQAIPIDGQEIESAAPARQCAGGAERLASAWRR